MTDSELDDLWERAQSGNRIFRSATVLKLLEEIERLTLERDWARKTRDAQEQDIEELVGQVDEARAWARRMKRERDEARDAAGIADIDLIRHNLEHMRAIETEQENQKLRGLLGRMAAELEAVYANRVEINWEEPGEGSPALIEYKSWKEKGS